MQADDKLLPEPTLLQKPVGVLFIFRKGAIAFRVDIEQMLFQVKVKKGKHCLRFESYKILI